MNVICPWMTKTQMVKGIEDGWAGLQLPTNDAEDVARAILICATTNRGQGGQSHGRAVLPFEGKLVWVAGGQAYEIEDNIQRLEPKWLGEENSLVVAKGQEYLFSPDKSWDASKEKA